EAGGARVARVRRNDTAAGHIAPLAVDANLHPRPLGEPAAGVITRTGGENDSVHPHGLRPGVSPDVGRSHQPVPALLAATGVAVVENLHPAASRSRDDRYDAGGRVGEIPARVRDIDGPAGPVGG